MPHFQHHSKHHGHGIFCYVYKICLWFDTNTQRMKKRSIHRPHTHTYTQVNGKRASSHCLLVLNLCFENQTKIVDGIEFVFFFFLSFSLSFDIVEKYYGMKMFFNHFHQSHCSSRIPFQNPQENSFSWFFISFIGNFCASK